MSNARRSTALALAVIVAEGCAPAQPASGARVADPTSAQAVAQGSSAAPPAPAASSPAVVPSVSLPAPPLPDQANDTTDLLSVTVHNPLSEPRANETISLTLVELRKMAPRVDLANALMADAGGAAVLSQLVDTDGDDSPDEIVFQTDFGPNESKSFRLRSGKRRPSPKSDYRVYGRFVRERHDDFAWENDVVAHRVYGPDLETWKKEPLTSSGVDTWVKRVPRLVINDWYLTDNYHEDTGEGADFYGVGKSRGCGGLGFWAGGDLHVSKNFTASRVLAEGPIRLIFELDYAPWPVGGARVAETRRVVLDAGSHFNRFESRFTGAPANARVAVGIANHAGSAVEVDGPSGWMRTWEPLDGGKSGHLGCAVVLPPPSTGEAHPKEPNYLFVTALSPSGRLVYYVGSTWDRASAVSSADAWSAEVKGLSRRVAHPVEVSLSPAATTK